MTHCETCGQSVKAKPETVRDRIMQVVSNYYDIDIEKIRSKNRKRRYCYPRQVMHYALRTHANMGLKNIGDMFGQDHTTVINSIKVVRALTSVYPEIAYDLAEITSRIMAKN